MRAHRSVRGSTIGSPELRSASPSLAFASATPRPCLCSQFAADRTVISIARASLCVATCARSLVRSRFCRSRSPLFPDSVADATAVARHVARTQVLDRDTRRCSCDTCGRTCRWSTRATTGQQGDSGSGGDGGSDGGE